MVVTGYGPRTARSPAMTHPRDAGLIGELSLCSFPKGVSGASSTNTLSRHEGSLHPSAAISAAHFAHTGNTADHVVDSLVDIGHRTPQHTHFVSMA